MPSLCSQLRLPYQLQLLKCQGNLPLSPALRVVIWNFWPSWLFNVSAAHIKASCWHKERANRTAINISICELGICPACPVCSLPSVCEVQGQLYALMDGLLLFCFIRDFVSSVFCAVETFFASQPKSRQHNLTTMLSFV